MKKSLIAPVLLLAGLACCAQTRKIYSSYADGALAKVNVRVVDQDGQPVSDAKIMGGFTTGCRMDDYILVDGLTNTNGEFTAESKCTEFLRFDVRKEGYYCTKEKIIFNRPKAASIVVDGKWLPYGETRTVVLKKIKNPVQIGEFGRCSIPIPVYDKWVGYDFEKKQWLPPYGGGKCSDVLLKFGKALTHKQFDYKMTMEVSFTNNPYAGFYQMKEDAFSERKTAYRADPNANFYAERSYVQERHPNAPCTDNRLDNDSYLIFRTRTKIDEKGRLISAHYGIIRGRWSFFSSMLSGGFLFNSTPNDTNLEDAETARRARLAYRQCQELEWRRKNGLR